MNIGINCELAGCNKLDFLPIKCIFCAHDYCEDHMTPERHSCPDIPNNRQNTVSSEYKPDTCALSTCSTPNGAKVICNLCKVRFWCLHRFSSPKVTFHLDSFNLWKTFIASLTDIQKFTAVLFWFNKQSVYAKKLGEQPTQRLKKSRRRISWLLN